MPVRTKDRQSGTGRSGRAKKGGHGGKFTWEGDQQLWWSSTGDLDPQDPLYASDDADDDDEYARLVDDTGGQTDVSAVPTPVTLRRQRSAPPSMAVRWNPSVTFDAALFCGESRRTPIISGAGGLTNPLRAPSLHRMDSHGEKDLAELSCRLFERLGGLVGADGSGGGCREVGSNDRRAEYSASTTADATADADADASFTATAAGAGGSALARPPLRRQTSGGRLAAADLAWRTLPSELLDALADERLVSAEGLAHRHAFRDQLPKPNASSDGESTGAGAGEGEGEGEDEKKSGSGSGGGLCAKRIMRELRRDLPRSLELGSRGAMFLRFDDVHLQYMRVLITGVSGTPYANGAFLFDMYCPHDYPHKCPLVKHVTPNANTFRGSHTPGGFSPNLHSDSGKVCLSLLGTWSGVGWTPGKSNVYQVLSSIQWMILAAEEPYYMEPSYGGWEGTVQQAKSNENDRRRKDVRKYQELIEYKTMELAILAPLVACTAPRAQRAERLRSGSDAYADFYAVLRRHFRAKRRAILEDLGGWIARAEANGSRTHRDRLLLLKPQIERGLAAVMRSEEGLAELRQAQQQVAYVLRVLHALRSLLPLGRAGCDDEEEVTRENMRQRMLAAQQELADVERSYLCKQQQQQQRQRVTPSRTGLPNKAALGLVLPDNDKGEDEDEDEDEKFGEAPECQADY